MLLPTQIQAILYCFLMGWLYAFLLSFMVQMSSVFAHAWSKGIMEILYHVTYALWFYYCLFFVNGAQMNPYLILLFIIGAFIYYLFYFSTFLELFFWLKRKLRPLHLHLLLVKKKILAIIKKPGRLLARRRANVKKNQKQRTAKTHKQKETSAENVF